MRFRLTPRSMTLDDLALLSVRLFERIARDIGGHDWPFWVTWRHQSRDHSNLNGPFPIGGPLKPSVYLQPFSRYWALSILGSIKIFINLEHKNFNTDTWRL